MFIMKHPCSYNFIKNFPTTSSAQCTVYPHWDMTKSTPFVSSGALRDARVTLGSPQPCSAGRAKKQRFRIILQSAVTITLTCSDYLALFGAAGNSEDASTRQQRAFCQLLSTSLYQVSTGRYTDSSDNMYFHIFRSTESYIIRTSSVR